MADKKIERYKRIYRQIEDLLKKSNNQYARMATVNAVLYHKMSGFFWVGFYLLDEGKLTVGPYQGPLACLELQKNKGVCWHSVNNGSSVVVPDVHAFPGHIACDSRSKSEIVIPVWKNSKIIGVLDIDSNLPDNFDETDRQELEKIVAMIC